MPARRKEVTRVEVRIPDPSCNPYLAFTVMLRAGLAGIEQGLEPGDPINQNIFDMSAAEKRRLNISQLPANLHEALVELRKDAVMREALGEHIYEHFMRAKQTIWNEYCAQVHPWELEAYLASY